MLCDQFVLFLFIKYVISLNLHLRHPQVSFGERATSSEPKGHTADESSYMLEHEQLLLRLVLMTYFWHLSFGSS